MISVVAVISTLFIYLLFSSLNTTNKDITLWIPSIFLMLVVPLFLLWILVRTYYIIDEKQLKYVSGPIRGSIPIADINQVIKNTTLWVGLKPATARNGIIIKYGDYNELYVSPVNNEKFIDHLLEYNPDIAVVDQKDEYSQKTN